LALSDISFGQKFQGVFERVKKIKKRGVKIGPKSLKKFTKKKNEMKIVMRFGTFGNYFWTRVPRRQNSKKMDKRGVKVGPRVYKILQKEKRKANNEI
jgi:hypothetical protein